MISYIRANYKKVLWCLLLTVIIIIAFLLFHFFTSPSHSPAVEIKEMPEAMKELAESDSVEWMAGIWAVLTNCVKSENEIAPNIETYQYTEDTIHASIMLQNGLDVVQPYFLMVFADGVPLEFKLNGETYQSYSLELTKAVPLEIEFQPDFSLGIGRLDFLMFYDGNPQSDYHMLSQTIWIEQPKEPIEPIDFEETIAQREGLQNSFQGNTYGSWLWNEGITPQPIDNIGPKEITLQEDESLLLEAIAARPGQYRTVLIADRQPIAYLDWESTGSNMLQLPVELPETLAEDFSFFTVTTPLERDSIDTLSLASRKVQLIYTPDAGVATIR